MDGAESITTKGGSAWTGRAPRRRMPESMLRSRLLPLSSRRLPDHGAIIEPRDVLRSPHTPNSFDAAHPGCRIEPKNSPTWPYSLHIEVDARSRVVPHREVGYLPSSGIPSDQRNNSGRRIVQPSRGTARVATRFGSRVPRAVRLLLLLSAGSRLEAGAWVAVLSW